MSRLRTMIVDDEPLAIERLEILCSDHPVIEIVGTANDGVAALRMAQQLMPDLIFLDIGMPKMDGINAARALGLMDKKPAIVLVTAYDNFAVEAFDLDVVDYVLKPVSSERLGRAIAREHRLARMRQRHTQAATARRRQFCERVLGITSCGTYPDCRNGY